MPRDGRKGQTMQRFERNWTTCSKYGKLSRLSSGGGGVSDCCRPASFGQGIFVAATPYKFVGGTLTSAATWWQYVHMVNKLCKI